MKTKEQLEKERQEDAEWCAKRFGIPAEDVIWYNSGSCYSRINVRTKESALKVREKVKGDAVNGGFLDGMPLGGISECKDENGNVYFDVTC